MTHQPFQHQCSAFVPGAGVIRRFRKLRGPAKVPLPVGPLMRQEVREAAE